MPGHVYVTSDSHYCHRNIIKYCNRPFLCARDRAEWERRGQKWHDGSWKNGEPWTISDESVHIMNKTMIAETNRIVGRDDILIHDGDFGCCPKEESRLPAYFQRMAEIREQINCRNIILIRGNHDHQVIAPLFSEYTADKQEMYYNVMCHFYHYGCFAWFRSHRSAIMLYGHSHGANELWLEMNMPGRRAMDVGVDNVAELFGRYRPLSLKDEIIPRLATRPGFSMNKDIPTSADGPEEG